MRKTLKKILKLCACLVLMMSMSSCISVYDDSGNFLYYDFFWNDKNPSGGQYVDTLLYGAVSGSGGYFGDLTGITFTPVAAINDDRNMGQDHFVDFFDSEDDPSKLTNELNSPENELLPFTG